MRISKWFFLLFAAALLFIAGVTSVEADGYRKFRAGQLTVMTQATYIDVWNERGGRWSPGYTCCQATLLDNLVSDLDERIDLIWVRQAPDHYGGPAVRGVRADVIGEEADDKTVFGLWPSDHAGVSAGMTLRVPRARR